MKRGEAIAAKSEPQPPDLRPIPRPEFGRGRPTGHSRHTDFHMSNLGGVIKSYLSAELSRELHQPAATGHNQILWNQVAYPNYLTNPPLFDVTRLLAITFHVPAFSTGSESYAFCVSNLSAVVGP